MGRATDSQMIHECGGTILNGGAGEQAHTYCDRCGAFQYDLYAGAFPTGTDRKANDEAWNDGEERSPDATDA